MVIRSRSVSRSLSALALALSLLALPLPTVAQDATQELPPADPAEVVPAPPADTAPPAPSGPTGYAALLDNQASLDRVELSITSLPPAPAGAVYRAWLRSDDLTLVQPLGDLSPDDTGAATLSWSQPAGESLFVSFSQVLITLESGPAGAQPGPIVMTAAVDPGALTQFRRLLVRWPDSRYGTASLQGLRQISAAAHGHAAVLREAAVHGDLPTVRRKAEHLVNVVEGSRGGFYGDLDGNGRAEDPGDGVGLLTYSSGALAQSQFAWALAQDERVATSALDVQPAVHYAMTWAGFVRDVGLELTQVLDPDRAHELAVHLMTAVQRVAAAIDPGADPTLTHVAAGLDFSPAYHTGLSLLRTPLLQIAPTAPTPDTAVARTADPTASGTAG